jgi:hypothetical protein
MFMATLDDIYNVLKELLDLEKKELLAAKSSWDIDVITINHAPAPLYKVQKIVRKAVLQNIGAEVITITKGPQGKAGTPAGAPANYGIELNPNPTGYYAGGSITLLNVDLSEVTAATLFTDNHPLAVISFT